jgi:RecB family endonuclease NucS
VKTATDAVRPIDDPTPEQARERIAAGIDAGLLVTIFGRCSVEYEGRARSELAAGDRHAMLKPDGTTLLHTNEGQQPVNWLPPGCSQTCRLSEGAVVVETTREDGAECLVIRFERVGLVTTFDVTDTVVPDVSGTESDLKARILETPALIEEGFRPLATERETAAGAVDVFGEDADGTTVVVELKRRRAGPDAVGQLDRYVESVSTDLHDAADLRGILAAPSVTDRGRALLATRGLEFVAVDPFGADE